MAHCIRFEIYIPVIYTINTVDQSGAIHKTPESLDQQLVEAFINDTTSKFQGVTQANPISPVPYRGFWKETPRAEIIVDRLTFLFGLVRIDQEDEAMRHFTEWKEAFEEFTEQNLILVVYYPVQTIGELFGVAQRDV